MKAVRNMLLACGALAVCGPVFSQSNDVAAERARLGNERAQLEADRRQQEELERGAAIGQAEAEQQQAVVPAPQAAPTVASTAVAPTPVEPREAAPPVQVDPAAVVPAAASSPPAPAAEAASGDISKALEQLRELGDLKDAGLVTDEEFERIKKRILDSQF